MSEKEVVEHNTEETSKETLNDDTEVFEEYPEDETAEEFKGIDFKKLDEMSDDEAILEIDKFTKENDTIIEQDYLSSLVKQEYRLVYYEIENIYSNPKSKAYRSRLKLKKDPPVLTIKDDYDNEAVFYLTENLTDELIGTLQQVKRAYYGFSGPAPLDVPDKFIDKIGYYAKNHPLKVFLPILTLILVVLAIIL